LEKYYKKVIYLKKNFSPTANNDFIFVILGLNFKHIVIYYFVVNIVLFSLMGIDKNKAKKHKWRIKEHTLFAFSFLGGGIGGFLGMKIFHHKTRKALFYVMFLLGILVHVIMWIGYFHIKSDLL